VYSMVQRREKEKNSRYIQEASAPAAAPCISRVTCLRYKYTCNIAGARWRAVLTQGLPPSISFLCRAHLSMMWKLEISYPNRLICFAKSYLVSCLNFDARAKIMRDPARILYLIPKSSHEIDTTAIA